MIKVILNGCNGRMGQTLTGLIGQLDDMKVVAGVDLDLTAKHYPVFVSLSDCSVEADVLIDFSHPKTLPGFLPVAIARRLPAVIATTGMSPDDVASIEAAAKKIPVFRTANMSLGVNLMQNLVRDASKVLGERYDVEIVEKHHKLKKDSPSGTALMLADSINEVRVKKLRYVCGREGRDSLRQADELGIHALRGGTIVGEHDVYFTGTDELIQVGHKAYTRTVFATGAIAAARYLARRKPGLYTMQDMINESQAVTTLYTYPGEVLVTLDGFPRDMQAISGLYGTFAKSDVFIDMISHAGGSGQSLSISFTIDSKDLGRTRSLLDFVKDANRGVAVTIDEDVTKLTVEGPGMEFQSGVAYRVFSCMAQANIHIKAVTTSEVKISYIVANDEVDRAVAIIKAEFGI